MARRMVALVLVSALTATGLFVAQPAPVEAAGTRDHGGVHHAFHFVDVGDGVTLHVAEAWNDLANETTPRRALLAIPPTLVTYKVWAADVPGDVTFNALHMAAQQGYRAYTFDHWGYGHSSKPANGMEVDFEAMLGHTAALVEWVRARSGAPAVDLLAGSLGNSIAIALGGADSPINADHVGAIVTTANVYAQASPVLGLTFLNPAVCNTLPPPPEGYTQTLGPEYAIILWNADPLAQAWGYQNFPGRYAQGPTQEGCDLPVYPASSGRAPVLVAYGDRDLLTETSDVEAFAHEYGGPVELLFLPGGGHAPHFEAVRHDFWDAAFAWWHAHRTA